jgi:hypothetical protein
MKGFFDRFSRTAPPPAPPPIPAATPAENDFAAAWQRFLGFGVDRDDLLQVLEESPFEPRLREYAARTLIDRYRDDLTIAELNTIIVYTSYASVSVEAGNLVMERATSKDDLGQVMLSVKSLRVRAAHIVLASNPGTHELVRCLDIPEVADEALERLLSPKTPRSTLLHLIRFQRRFAPAIREYLEANGRRADFTPHMAGALKLLAESPHTDY